VEKETEKSIEKLREKDVGQDICLARKDERIKTLFYTLNEIKETQGEILNEIQNGRR
jgi:hypothetical protein